MAENLLDLLFFIESKMDGELVNSEIVNNELSILINSKSILKFVEFLISDSECQFSTLIDITAVDYVKKT
jgi:NADH-quinone oxidoreductase subunit C